MAHGLGANKVVLASDQTRDIYGMTAGTWLRVIKHLQPEDRAAIGPTLSRVYPGLDPSTDHHTAIYLDLRKFNVELRESVRKALRKENIMVEAVEFDVTEDEDVEETAAPAKKTRKRSAKRRDVVIPEGYGDQERGTWFPGYDAKWKSVLIKRVRANDEGSEAAAAEMVSRGWWTQDVADERIAQAREKENRAAAEAETDGTEADEEIEFEEIDDEDDGDTDDES